MSRNRKRARGGARGAGGGKSPFVNPMYGVQGFSNANWYQTANSGGEQGNATGFTLAALISIDSQSVASGDKWILGPADLTAPACDYQLRTTGTNSALSFGIRTTAGGSQVFTASVTITAGMLGRILHVVCTFNQATGQIQMHVDTVAGATAAAASYAVPDTPTPDAIGRLATLAFGGATGITVYGRASGHGVMTQAEIEAHRAACLAALDIVPVSGAGITATHTYSVKQDMADQGPLPTVAGATAAPATLADRTGASNFTRQGSPTGIVRSNPPWA